MISLWKENETAGISDAELRSMLEQGLEGQTPKKILLIPPDITRMNSGAGKITAMYYELLSPACHVDILPALGTHEPMTPAQILEFFGGGIPSDRLLVHDWRNGVRKMGEVPGEFVREVSDGIMDEPVDVEVSTFLTDGGYDLIFSIGQVVPHEVVGMANYTKNILVGCGGSRMINRSHMLGAFYGMERVMGRDFSPVRKVFDYAEQNFLQEIPIVYVLTVTVTPRHEPSILGLYIGRERALFERAVALSQKHNLNSVREPFETCVVYLDEREFRSTWLGNKAIYRTRMAMADGGRLIILAPGVCRFGEDAENDRLIRQYGYKGREEILKLSKTEKALQENLSVAAHLIHGSSDGRFEITYAVSGLTREEIESCGFTWADYADTARRYDPEKLIAGYNTLPGGEKIYYIPNPALGLWTLEGKF